MAGNFDHSIPAGHMTVPVDAHTPLHYAQQQPHRLRPIYPACEAAVSPTYPPLPPVGQERVHMARPFVNPPMPVGPVYPALLPAGGAGVGQAVRRDSFPDQKPLYFAAPFPHDTVTAQSNGVSVSGPARVPYSYGPHDAARAMRVSVSRQPTQHVGSALSSHSAADPIVPTYHGLIKDSTDAILLLAACDLPLPATGGIVAFDGTEESLMQPSPPPRRIHRRLLEHERPELIRPGSVFVWDEEDAGMRRWTDGRCWSASRVSGCFLTYRELEMRKRPAGDGHGPRANLYKVEGLIKQSFSMTSGSGRKLHIVSYYTKRDLRERTLRRVSEDPRFVGEAGGEWGLSVDEQEYPDPVSDSAPACAERSQSHFVEPPRVAHDRGSSDDATSFRTRATPTSPHQVQASSPRWQSTDWRSSPTQSFPAASGSCAVRKVSEQEVDDSRAQLQDASLHSAQPRAQSVRHPQAIDSRDSVSCSGPLATANVEARPPLKRQRSSSAGESLSRRPSGPSPLERLLPGRHGDAPALRASGHLLTESNIRGAMGSSMASRRLADPGCLTPTSSQDQDSAVGALLSLKGSHVGSASQNNETPLTTPEGCSDDTGTPTGGMPLRTQSSGQGSASVPSPGDRTQGPKRFSSDRDILSKLSVRL